MEHKKINFLGVSNINGISLIKLSNAIGGGIEADHLQLSTVSNNKTVKIDVKPGDDKNIINPNNHGKISLGILTTDSPVFDAIKVDPATVRFGPTGREVAPSSDALENIDVDGDIDMMFHFIAQETSITCGDISATLRGETYSGEKILGTDSIKTVSCE